MRSWYSAAAAASAAVALAACSHGASSVAPVVGSPSQHMAGAAGDLSGQLPGQGFGNAAPVCGPVPAGYARCFAWLRTDLRPQMNVAPGMIYGLHPADFQAAYQLPSATAGGGETVAVVDAFDDPNAESDLGVYRSAFGLAPCTTANGCFHKLNQFGQPSPLPAAGPSNWVLEESLDVDMVSAICPNCHIMLMESNSNTFFDLAQAVMSAVHLGAVSVSNSYGGGEVGSQQFEKYYNHRKAIITASSGDSGYAGGPQFPASSGYVVSVGGTQLTKNSHRVRGWVESAWSGAGSGCSTVYPKPAWQTDALCAMRTIADTSADAAPNSGPSVYDTYHGGGWIVVGGTSVASPIIASVYALAGNATTLDYAKRLYTFPHRLWDVTTGNNGGCGNYICQAGPGYDGPTGMGTPHNVGGY